MERKDFYGINTLFGMGAHERFALLSVPLHLVYLHAYDIINKLRKLIILGTSPRRLSASTLIMKYRKIDDDALI